MSAFVARLTASGRDLLISLTSICRLQTFGGKLVFNMDYNPDAIPREVAEEWTQAWVDTAALIA